MYTSIGNIPQCNELPILGITFQPDCKFSLHVRNKLREANKCLYILRSLRKEGLDQAEINNLFNIIVMPKITYGLPVYGSSDAELTIIQYLFLRRYIYYPMCIYKLLEKCDIHIFKKMCKQELHPLRKYLPRIKPSTRRLRHSSYLRPKVKTERFKNSDYILKLSLELS